MEKSGVKEKKIIFYTYQPAKSSFPRAHSDKKDPQGNIPRGPLYDLIPYL